MTKFITISPTELEALIQESVRKVFLEERGQNLSQPADEIFTIVQAAGYLKIAKQTLYGYTSKNLIPFIKVGKKLLFRKSDLDLWLNEGKKKSISELEKELEEEGHG